MIKNIVFDLYGVLINDRGLMHDTADILKLCSRKGYACFGLSNITESEREKYVAAYPILRNLKFIMTSEMAGASKPSPEIFHALTQIANIQMGESIFIDDSSTNCGAAKRLGFHHSIHFTDAHNLAHALDLWLPNLFSEDETQKCNTGCSCHPH